MKYSVHAIFTALDLLNANGFKYVFDKIGYTPGFAVSLITERISDQTLDQDQLYAAVKQTYFPGDLADEVNSLVPGGVDHFVKIVVNAILSEAPETTLELVVKGPADFGEHAVLTVRNGTDEWVSYGTLTKGNHPHDGDGPDDMRFYPPNQMYVRFPKEFVDKGQIPISQFVSFMKVLVFNAIARREMAHMIPGGFESVYARYPDLRR